MVEDTRSGRTFRVSGPREWWERLHGPEIRRLAERVRWVGGEWAPARRTLVAEYQRLAGLLGLEPAEIHRGSELGRGGGGAPVRGRGAAREHARRALGAHARRCAIPQGGGPGQGDEGERGAGRPGGRRPRGNRM